MSTSDAGVRRLTALLKKLRGKAPEASLPAGVAGPAGDEMLVGVDAGVHRLLHSMLLWEASSSQAKGALRRLREAFVDANELRVSMPDEIACVLGEKYPRGEERAARLRLVLHDVYKRHHALTLAPLAQAGKREARAALESLEGIPHYAAARVFLLEFGGHAVPCDERLRTLLVGERVLEESLSVEAASGWLERHIRAEDAPEAHAALQAWSDEHGTSARRASKPEASARAARGTKTRAKAGSGARRAGGKTRSGG
mgnify:CR=1 FL=1|jgi:endonuclease III